MFFVDDNQKANFAMSYAFPLIVHETNLKDKPLGFNNWHWHEELQFTIVLEGEMVMTMQGENYLLHPGDGIFINSNIEHMTRPTTPQSARYLSLNVQPSLLTLFHGSVVEQKYYLPYIKEPHMQVVTFSSDGLEELLFAEVNALFRVLQDGGFGYELDAYSRLLNTWKLLLACNAAEHAQHQPHERYEAKAMLAYLHEHYSERISLDDVSAHVHISKSECCRLFHASYGCSIFTYLSDYRLQKSILLLSDSHLSVLEISDLCGFNSTSYFIKTFREKVGMTPLQYRRKAAQDKR